MTRATVTAISTLALAVTCDAQLTMLDRSASVIIEFNGPQSDSIQSASQFGSADVFFELEIEDFFDPTRIYNPSGFVDSEVSASSAQLSAATFGSASDNPGFNLLPFSEGMWRFRVWEQTEVAVSYDRTPDQFAGSGFEIRNDSAQLIFQPQTFSDVVTLDLSAGVYEIEFFNASYPTAGFWVDSGLQLEIEADWVSSSSYGDFDGDGFVGLLDLDILGMNWNSAGSPQQGDANGDGLVGLLDLDIVGANWTGISTAALSAFAISVPEPTGLILLTPFVLMQRLRGSASGR